MKRKEAGLLARSLKFNSKALYISCANHSLNIAVVNRAKSSPKAMLFFWVLMQLCAFFSSFTQYWTILKECAATTQIKICYLLGESNSLHLTFAISFG